jgi:PAS domain S-box-containing protein
MGKNAPIPGAPAAGGKAGCRFETLLHRHRDRIIREWRDRLLIDVSDHYTQRDPDELSLTTARAYDAFALALTGNDYTGINLFINEITKVRLESGFPLDDVQKAFELFRIIILPVLVDESPKHALHHNLEQVNTCLAYTIQRFSHHFQKMHETCLTEYADRLEKDVAARTAQLQESEHKYKTLVEEISDGYLVLQAEKIAFVNVAFCHMHGIENPDDIFMTSFLHFVHTKDREAVRRIITRKESENAAPAVFEYERLTKEGQALPTEMGFRPSRFESQNYNLCIVRDITRRVQMEKKSRQTERMAYIGQITASLSHEIRNPLSSIKMNLQILGQNNPFTGNDQKRLDITQTEIQRLETILQQLLDFAKPISLAPGPVDVNQVVDFCVTLLDVKFRKIQAECKVILDPSLPGIPADKAKIEQVVINLLLNALDSVPAGGKITVATGTRTMDGMDFVALEVADNGKGIEKELIPHIFEPFYTTKTMGTGLGLANVKQIVQAHNGRVRVGTRDTCGTVFTILLPCGGIND